METPFAKLTSKTIHPFLAILLTANLIGCSGDTDRPDLAHVSGTITLNDEPLQFATVTFWPASGGQSSFGVTDESGHYELMYRGNVSGAKIGTCRVSISTLSEDIYDDETGETLIREAQEERVPASFNDNSQLEFEVQSGKNSANFNLKGTR